MCVSKLEGNGPARGCRSTLYCWVSNQCRGYFSTGFDVAGCVVGRAQRTAHHPVAQHAPRGLSMVHTVKQHIGQPQRQMLPRCSPNSDDSEGYSYGAPHTETAHSSTQLHAAQRTDTRSRDAPGRRRPRCPRDESDRDPGPGHYAPEP
jgi:hypothetical protein